MCTRQRGLGARGMGANGSRDTRLQVKGYKDGESEGAVGERPRQRGQGGKRYGIRPEGGVVKEESRGKWE